MNESAFLEFAHHEAGHFIIYLLNCREDRKHPHINELSILPKKGKKTGAYISVKSDTTPEITESILKSDLPEIYKEAAKDRAIREIKFLLAGIAGELILLDSNDSLRLALPAFYRKEKRIATSDLSRSVSLNIAIGGKAEDGITPLINILHEALKDLLIYKNDFSCVVNLLIDKKRIGANELAIFADDFYSKYFNKPKNIEAFIK